MARIPISKPIASRRCDPRLPEAASRGANVGIHCQGRAAEWFRLRTELQVLHIFTERDSPRRGHLYCPSVAYLRQNGLPRRTRYSRVSPRH